MIYNVSQVYEKNYNNEDFSKIFFVFSKIFKSCPKNAVFHTNVTLLIPGRSEMISGRSKNYFERATKCDKKYKNNDEPPPYSNREEKDD